MILQQAMMKMSQAGNKTVNKLVLLHESGLAIHKDPLWGHVISHFNSGKSVLKHIKERKDIEGYIKQLIDICSSWTFTLEAWNNISAEDKQCIKEKVDKIQQEILQQQVK